MILRCGLLSFVIGVAILLPVDGKLLSAANAQSVSLGSGSGRRACPTIPDEIMGMIDELKGTFECGGFNLKECNQYRSGLIGGGIAASVAAGIGSLKSRPRLAACLLPGTTVSVELPRPIERGRYQFALKALGLAQPLAAHAAPRSCNLPTKELAKVFTAMSREHHDEANKIRGQMVDALLSQKVTSADLEKVEVSDSALRSKFLEGLDELEKAVKADADGRISSPRSRDWYLDDIKKLKAQFRAGGSFAEMHKASLGLIDNYIPSEIRGEMSSSTLQKIRVWHSRTALRAEKIATLGDPALQVTYKKALAEVDVLTGMTQWSGRTEYLKNLGYSKDVIDKVLEADGARRQISMRGSALQMASHDLSFGRLKDKTVLAAADLKEFMRTRAINFYDHPMLRFSHIPSLNSGLVKTVGSAGRAAMARLSSVAAGDLAGLTKVGLKGAALVGSKAFAAVSETAFRMGAVDCRECVCHGSL
jgi:hypothetical protein